MTSTDADKVESEHKQTPFKAVRETVLLLAFAIILALVVKTFFVQSFYIPSESMQPGLIVNDRILVEKPSYWGSGGPERGDVIVFDDPGNWLSGLEEAQPMSFLARGLAKIGLYPTGGHLVKRVIGVAGDTIQCCDDQGQIMVNGQAIDENDFIEPQTARRAPAAATARCPAATWTATGPPGRCPRAPSS